MPQATPVTDQTPIPTDDLVARLIEILTNILASTPTPTPEPLDLIARLIAILTMILGG